MIVVDWSVAAKWVLPEEQSGLALALLGDHIGRGERVVGPHLLAAEITNVVHRHLRRAALSEQAATAALDRFLALPIELLPRGDVERASLHRRALAIAVRHGLPAAYDAHYLALSEMLDCEVWTADERLARQLEGRVPTLRLLGSYVEG